MVLSKSSRNFAYNFYVSALGNLGSVLFTLACARSSTLQAWTAYDIRFNEYLLLNLIKWADLVPARVA